MTTDVLGKIDSPCCSYYVLQRSVLDKAVAYSRVPNNTRGWNNRGGGGVGIIEGVGRGRKNTVGGFLVLKC